MAMSDKELFAQAINEGVMSRMELDLAEFEGKVTCSKSHYRRISEIIGYRVGPSEKRTSFKRAVAVALIAAALLLAGCAAVVYKDRIGDFFVEIFDTHIKGSFAEGSENNNEIIEEYYSLSYVPEGYSKIMEFQNDAVVMRKYVNENQDTIRFEQLMLDSINHYIDVEHGEIDEVKFSDINVFYYSTIDTHLYVWKNDEYAFLVETTDELLIDEIEKIICGVSQIQN